MVIFSTDDVLKRLRKLADVETNKELAKLLNINEKTLAGWKSRNSLPIEALMAFSEQYGVSTDFLLKGKENKLELDELSKGLLERFQALDFEGKLAILNAVTNKSAVNSGSVSQSAQGNVKNMVAGDQIND